MSVDTTQTAAPPAPEFITGELCKLRPVLEADLPALARLLAAAPHGFSFEREPWTQQRLRKKFEDETHPGLWKQTKRYYAVTDHAGQLVGALVEDLGRLGGSEVLFHIALERDDRDALGQDMLAAFMAYKRGWQNCPRIAATVLEVQTAEAGWLRASGFAHEIHCAEAWLCQGERTGIEMYAWLADWVTANRAPAGIGE